MRILIMYIVYVCTPLLLKAMGVLTCDWLMAFAHIWVPAIAVCVWAMIMIPVYIYDRIKDERERIKAGINLKIWTHGGRELHRTKIKT